MKIYQAVYESRNFTFEGVSTTETEAKKVLLRALKLHTKQYDLDAGWYHKDDIYVVGYELGKPYRDRQEMRLT